jgi:hypothetical protein
VAQPAELEPRRSIRITVPFLIAIVAVAARYSGVVARNQQTQELSQLNPRSLSDSQRAELKKRLPKDTPPIRIIYRLMDGEGKDFSEHLASAIKDAGGSVEAIVGNSLNDLRGKVVVGATSTDQRILDAVDNLCATFNQINISCGGDLAPRSISGVTPPGELVIIVGRKE